MVIVGVGAAGPGSGRTTRDSLCVSLFEFSPPARKWQSSLFGTPRPLFISVCVCVCIVGRRVMFWAPGSRDWDGVPSGLLPPSPGADAERWSAGAVVGRARQSRLCRPTVRPPAPTASETLTAGMGKAEQPD